MSRPQRAWDYPDFIGSLHLGFTPLRQNPPIFPRFPEVDWLMPAMDAFREWWSQVELELVIVSVKRDGVIYHPLFGYEVLALLSHRHPLVRKAYLTTRDFKNEVLVTYPIPDKRLDLVRDVLRPVMSIPRAEQPK